MALVTKTETFHAVGYDTTLSHFNAITNPNNFVGEDTTNTSYTQWSLVTGSKAETYVFVTFDFSSIPSNATIDSVEAKIKIAGTGNAYYVASRQVRGYNDGAAFGFSESFSTSASTITMDLGSGDWDLEKLNNFTIRAYARRSTSNTSSNYYIRIYGVDVTVTYTYSEQTDILYIKRNGSMIPVEKVYKKVNGSIVEQDITTAFDSNTNYVRGN